MTDRERLIELLKQVDFDFSEECVACCEDGYKTTPKLEEFFADHLLANGVIVPPCKVGDTVWYELYGQIESAVIYSCIGNLTRGGFIITDANAKDVYGLEVVFNGKCLGKTVFLTKEEAEKALKERERDD